MRMSNGIAIIENSMEILEIIKKRTTIWFDNYTSGYISKVIQSRILKRWLHTYIYFSIIHNRQWVQTTLKSISG